MNFKAETALRSPDKQLIREFESKNRVRLPDSYLTTLEIGNGAVPITNVFPQGKHERMIERMLCLLANPSADPTNGWYDINVVISQIGERLTDNPDLVGMNVIPIASLFGGDLLCLDYRFDKNAPRICVWNHEESEDLQPVLEVVADSFDAFDSLLETHE